jgi:hypothetical protein
VSCLELLEEGLLHLLVIVALIAAESAHANTRRRARERWRSGFRAEKSRERQLDVRDAF